MSRVSRPYQIALAAVLLLAVAWFVALRPHSSSSGPSASLKVTATSGRSLTDPHSTSRRSAAAPQKSSKGLKAAQGRKAAAGGKGRSQAPSVHSRPQSPAAAGGSERAGVSRVSQTRRSSTRSHVSSGASSSGRATDLSRGQEIGAQLAEGKTVLLLFWNPRSATDVAVRDEVETVGAQLKAKVAIDYAKPSEVGTFGTVTRNISIYETPTLLIVAPHRLVTTMTGLTDAFSIEQAIREARR